MKNCKFKTLNFFEFSIKSNYLKYFNTIRKIEWLQSHAGTTKKHKQLQICLENLPFSMSISYFITTVFNWPKIFKNHFSSVFWYQWNWFFNEKFDFLASFSKIIYKEEKYSKILIPWGHYQKGMCYDLLSILFLDSATLIYCICLYFWRLARFFRDDWS